jgi:DNA-binding IclR family transcriptional regulator
MLEQKWCVGGRVPRSARKSISPVVGSAGSAAQTAAGRAPDEESGPSYSIGVLKKATTILSVFSHRKPSLGLKELSTLTGIPKTTTFRILSTLVEQGLCEFDETSETYSLGFYLLHLASIRQRQTDVHSVAVPVMRELRDAVGETVVLSIRSGESRVHIEAVEGVHPMRRTADLGLTAPLYAGAASKVLLAGMEDEEIKSYLQRTPLTKFQKSTITDPKSLIAEIHSIRQRGYSESKGELISGGAALAAPIRDHSGRTVAVIDVLTPEYRYTPEYRAKCIQLLLESTRKCSQRMGLRG